MSALPTTSEAQPDTNILLREDRDGIAFLTLNRPHARNSLSVPMLTALQEAFDSIKADNSIRVVVLAGNGPAFSAGHDLREVRGDTRPEFHQALLRQCSKMMQTIVSLPQPVIAEVAGVATAAGCQLVASCDLAVAGEGARFGTPGVNIGLFCSTPMVALSRNVTPKHAMEMLLLGELVDAETAMRFGLVNRVVPASALRRETEAMARKIASKSPVPIKIGKVAYYRQLEMTLPEAYEYTTAAMMENFKAHDAAEGMDAFIEKRPPVWRGC